MSDFDNLAPVKRVSSITPYTKTESVEPKEFNDLLMTTLFCERWGNLPAFKKELGASIDVALKNLPDSAFVLAEGIRALMFHYRTPAERVLRILREQDPYNKSAIEFVDKNSDLFNEGMVLPPKFLELIASDVKNGILFDKKHVDQKNRFLIEVHQLIRTKLSNHFDRVLSEKKYGGGFDLQFLTQAEQKQNLPSKQKDVLGYLSSFAEPKTAVAMAHLYLWAKTNYHYNGDALTVTDFLKQHQGDCTEHMIFYFTLLKNHNVTLQGYQVEFGGGLVDHVFVAGKFDNKYLLADGKRLVLMDDFSKAFTYFLPNVPDVAKIKRVDIERFRNGIYDNAFDSEITLKDSQQIAPE